MSEGSVKEPGETRDGSATYNRYVAAEEHNESHRSAQVEATHLKCGVVVCALLA